MNFFANISCLEAEVHTSNQATDLSYWEALSEGTQTEASSSKAAASSGESACS